MSEIDYKWDLSEESKSEEFKLELDFYDEKEQEDKLWQARTGLNFETLCGALETLIFMSDKPISIQKLKSQIDEELPLRVVYDSISKLQKRYEEKLHGIRLVEVAEGYQFRTKATFAKYVQSLFKVNSLVLTPTALEVLAIIAYKQPVSKTEVEKIRGVDSSHIVRALIDKRLVKISGRSDEIGRPSLYTTTPEFLEVFNLATIDDLPSEAELTELAIKNTTGNISDIKSVVFMGDKKKFDFDEFEELDQLSSSIKNIPSDTFFTSTLKLENKKKKEDEQDKPKKSAFDILEDFVNLDQSTKQNTLAANSETPMNVLEAKIVDIASEKIWNAPEDIDQDLEEEVTQDLEVTGQTSEVQDVQTISSEEVDEALELEMALNKAFENLTGKSLEDEEITTEEVLEVTQDIEINTDEIIAKADALDLDLSFLKDSDN